MNASVSVNAEVDMVWMCDCNDSAGRVVRVKQLHECWSGSGSQFGGQPLSV